MKKASTLPTLLALIALMALIVIATSTSSALTVAGVVFEGSVAPGEMIAHELNVSLAKDEGSMNLTVDIMDWRQDLDGTNSPTDQPESTLRSARSFLAASPREFRLDEGGHQKILITGNIPAGAGPGGLYAIFSVHSTPMPSSFDSSVGVQVAVNGLIRLTVSGSDLDRSGEITNLSLAKPLSRTEPAASLTFNNTGNVHYKMAASAILQDEEGNVLANSTQPLTNNIIPNAAREIKLSFKPDSELQPGIYEIEASAALENGTMFATKTLRFEIE